VSLQNEAPVFKPRKLYHGYIAAPGKADPLDEVLLAVMPTPNSYTREDVVEIQAHAGAVVLKKILDLVLEQGARLAEPGEFTRRAYLNGRIDLSRAEAVIDVIQAKTETALKIASRHLEGTLERRVRELKAKLQDLHAELEAGIEFPEDVDESHADSDFCPETLEGVRVSLEDILGGYQKGHVLRDGLRLAIVGKVNVGKSSLLNRLLQKDRAIVTDIPGTTRDHIEETLDIAGLPVILIDTAGWRDTNDPVEKIGIDRTRDLASSADLVLFMADVNRGILSEDQTLYQKIQDKEKILVVNKKDLAEGTVTMDIPHDWRFEKVVYTSVKFDRGIDTLMDEIYRFGTQGWVGGESDVVPNLRQKKLFEKALRAVETARGGMEENAPPELTVVDLKDALDALDEVTGTVVRGDVLDAVFSRFCIGK
jgi:tRNA modification GTPase